MDISEIFFRKFKYSSVFSLRNSGSCAVIKNIPKGNEVLAIHELVVVTVCHFGGPRYVLQIHSVATFSQEELKTNTAKYFGDNKKCCCTYIFFICDSCDTNVILFMEKLNLHRKIFMCITDFHIILVYDYVNFFKNISDNWITDQNRELLLTEDGNQHYT